MGEPLSPAPPGVLGEPTEPGGRGRGRLADVLEGVESYARAMELEDLPTIELAFPGPLRDSGVAAILEGRKTAMTGLLEIYEHSGEAVPEAGQRFAVLDSDGRPAVVIELVEVRVIPMKKIDDDYVRAEGRGYADAAEWRAVHEEFFRSEGVSAFLGHTPVIDDGTLVVAERFRVVEPGGPGRS